MAEGKIQIVIDPTRAQAGANAVERAVNGVKQSFLELSAKIFVAEQAVERVWRAAQRGAEFEETMARLNRQTAAYHSTAQLMVNDLQAISNQTLSIDKAASMASRGLAIGLNPDQIRTFTEAADVLKEQIGTDLPQAFDQIMQAAITGRSAVLANIGVYIDLEEEAKKLAVATGRATDEITRQERMMLATNAVAGQTGHAMKRLSDGTVSDADRLRQYVKEWDEATLALDRFAKKAVILGMDIFKELPGPKFLTWLNSILNPAKGDPFQEVMGRAIVAQTTRDLMLQAEDKAKARQSPPPTLSATFRATQLEGEFQRRGAGLEGMLDRERLFFETSARFIELDAQLQFHSQESLARRRGDLRMEELSTVREFLRQQDEAERVFHEQRIKLGFETTQERIAEEERHRGKVFENNLAIRKNDAETSAARQLTAAELAQAIGRDTQARGERLRDQAKSEFDITESLRRQDSEARQQAIQADIEMGQARFESDQETAQRERQLLREQLAFKLKISTEEATWLLHLRRLGRMDDVRDVLAGADATLSPTQREAITTQAAAQDIRLRERAIGDFFAGWGRGLQDYISRTDGAFNLANDMARRTAQTMEQGFQRFFFDGMEGKFKGFKDVLTGVLDFTKQIVAQMAAQMVTVGIIKPGAAALGNWLGGLGGTNTGTGTGTTNTVPLEASLQPVNARFGGIVDIERFAFGGITHRPRRMALGGSLVEFGEGPQAEAFVPLPDGRTIPVTLKYDGALSKVSSPYVAPTIHNTVQIEVSNEVPGTHVQAESVRGPDGRDIIKMVIRSEITSFVSEGGLDQPLRNRYNMNPSPARR